MSEWQEVSLGEITSKIGSGATPRGGGESYKESGTSLIRSQNILDFKFSTNGLAFIDDAQAYELRSVSVEPDDVLLNITGDSVARCCVVPDNILPARVNQHVAIVRANKDKAESHFIYYMLQSIKEELLMQSEIGATRNALTKGMIEGIKLSLPPLPEQKAIASVLSSLDDKIDLLHRQNTTLESMAETLFRQWFVEEAKEDWSFVVLGEYVNCFNGVSYKSSELNASKTAMVTLKSFDRNGGFRLDGFKEFTGRYKEQHIVVQGDLVVAHTDITQDAEVIGNPILVVASPSYETIVISMDLVKVTSKFDWLSNEFLYRMMRTREFKEHCLGYSNGSTVLHLSKQAIPSFEFFLPPKEKIEGFTKLAKDLFSKKFKNIEQIQTLEKLRDTLLPKLMSGEIHITTN